MRNNAGDFDAAIMRYGDTSVQGIMISHLLTQLHVRDSSEVLMSDDPQRSKFLTRPSQIFSPISALGGAPV